MLEKRLKMIRESLGLSQQAFGRRIGMAQSSYANYESGRSILPATVLQVLSDELDVNLKWLVTGEGGHMFGTEAEEEAREEPRPNYRYLVGHRLKEVRTAMGYDVDAKLGKWCDEIDFDPVEYKKYETQEILMPERGFAKIAKRFESLNMDWLRFGIPPIWRGDRVDAPVNPSNEKVADIESRLARIPGDPPVRIEETDNMPVPMTSLRISAGKGEDWGDGDLTGEVVYVPKKISRLYPKDAVFAGAVVRGDSMEPTLRDGEPVVFASGCPLNRDGIYVLAAHGDLMVKRIEFNRVLGKLRIISDNPKYPPTAIDLDDGGADVRILGKVVMWIHKEEP